MEPPKIYGHLPRLDPEHYRGLATVHWTMTIQDRRTGWLDSGRHAAFREALLHTLVRYEMLCPTYCFMPDHIHLVWMGTALSTDQRLALEFFRRQTNQLLAPFFWQKQAYDHVLREHERERGAFSAVCHYILANPVRAGLAAKWEDYGFSGTCIPGYPDVDPRRDDYWEVYWKVYAKQVGRSVAAP
jgi:REP element-mobilizing transposase RayT